MQQILCLLLPGRYYGRCQRYSDQQNSDDTGQQLRIYLWVYFYRYYYKIDVFLQKREEKFICQD